MPFSPPSSLDEFLASEGEIGAAILAKDWSATSLGPMERWPIALKTTLRLVLKTRQATVLFWGPDLLQFFNEPYAHFVDGMAPDPIGRPFKEYWAEVFEGVRPYYERAIGGEGTWEEDLQLRLTRNGVTEDTWWSFSYSPIYDDDGAIAGFINVVNETTAAVKARQALTVAQSQLASERDRLGQMFEQAPTFMALLSGPEHRVDMANPGYLKLVGHRPLIGMTVAQALPDAAAQGYVGLLDEVYRSGKAYSASGALYAVQTEAGGPTRERYVDFVYQPMRDARGEVSGIFVEGTDVTNRVEGELSLRESEERLKLVIDGARDYAIITIAPDRRIVGWSRGAAEIYGLSESEAIGLLTDELFTEEDREAGTPWRDLEMAKQHGVAPDIRWHVRRDGGRVFMDGFVRKLPPSAFGKEIGFIKIARNATAEKLEVDRQAALLSLGDQLREATSVAEVAGIASQILGKTLDVGRAGYARIDVKSDILSIENDWTTKGMESLAGRRSLAPFQATIDRAKTGETMALSDIRDMPWIAPDLSSYSTIGTRARIAVPLLIKGELVGMVFCHDPEPRAWSEGEIDFARRTADRTYAAMAKIQAEQDQALLNEEISHRLKNTLALVQAVASQTLRGVPERGPVAAFEKRLQALGTAHDVLLRRSWMSASIRQIVLSVIENVSLTSRFKVSGPDFQMGPRSALSLSLLIHELATNALKYGALTCDDGIVTVAWSIDAAGDLLKLHWKESGGPAVHQPTKGGFGSRLIRMGLAGTGGVDLRYGPDGFEAAMTAPLAQLTES